MSARSYGKALGALYVLVAFFSAFNKIWASDTWLHLSIGRLIWQLKGLPVTEPFTYPTFGEHFSYNSWLFGLLIYAINQHLGVYGLVLLKASVIAITFYILLKDSLRPYRNCALAVMVMTAAIALSQFRFVLRPDIFFMLFLSFSIFSMNAYLYEGKKYIYALPLIHLLWANMHASIVVMFVPFLAFICGSIIKQHLSGQGKGDTHYLSKQQLRVLIIVFVVSFAFTLVTPYFSLQQYIYGAKYETSAWHTKHIIENFYPPELLKLMIGIAAVVLVSFLFNRRRFSIIHLLLVVPFIILSFAGHRFVFVMGIVGFPIFIRNIAGSLESKSVKPGKAIFVIAALCVSLFGIDSIADSMNKRNFGFGFDYSKMPKGAVEYLDERRIYGRTLNHYNFGQFIVWESYPKRPVFIDGRGHLPEDLLQAMLEFTTEDGVLEELYDKFGFKYIVAAYKREEKKTFVPTTDPRWALVYWDDASLVYLRRDAMYKNIIAQDEYRVVRPEVSPLWLLDIGDRQIDRDGLVSELERNVAETGSVRALVSLGYIRLAEGSLDKARDYLMAAAEKKPEDASTNFGLGLLYERLGDKKAAWKHFRRAVMKAKYVEISLAAKNKLDEMPGR